MREAEHRSTAFLPYWDLPLATAVVPRQRRCREAMATINSSLDGLIAKCQRLVGSPAQLLHFIFEVPGLDCHTGHITLTRVVGFPHFEPKATLKCSLVRHLRRRCLQVDVEDQEFEEEFLSQEDPSMLHFLLASGEQVGCLRLELPE